MSGSANPTCIAAQVGSKKSGHVEVRENAQFCVRYKSYRSFKLLGSKKTGFRYEKKYKYINSFMVCGVNGRHVQKAVRSGGKETVWSIKCAV